MSFSIEQGLRASSAVKGLSDERAEQVHPSATLDLPLGQVGPFPKASRSAPRRTAAKFASVTAGWVFGAGRPRPTVQWVT